MEKTQQTQAKRKIIRKKTVHETGVFCTSELLQIVSTNKLKVKLRSDSNINNMKMKFSVAAKSSTANKFSSAFRQKHGMDVKYAHAHAHDRACRPTAQENAVDMVSDVLRNGTIGLKDTQTPLRSVAVSFVGILRKHRSFCEHTK